MIQMLFNITPFQNTFKLKRSKSLFYSLLFFLKSIIKCDCCVIKSYSKSYISKRRKFFLFKITNKQYLSELINIYIF